VASTLSLSDEDFNNGNYQFSGDGNNAAVVNHGTLNADGGAVALLGGQVSNHGIIQANQGTVALAAGDKITLDFAGDGLLNVTVDEGTLNALAENHQLVRANGGQVVMTANATNALLQSVVNNTGIVEAQTLDNQSGTIVLKGGFNGGTVNVAGTLDASALESGDGGFIDTSGAHVKIADGTRVTTKANNGATGEWLIDPTDFYITDSNDPQTDSGIGAATLSANLEDSNISLATIEAGTDAGDMYVNGAVSWNANTTLSLSADNNILINAPITVENSGGGVALNYGGSHYQVNAPISFTAGSGGAFSVNGLNFTLIHSIAQLQNINTALDGHYALATDIDASETQTWNSNAGFNPIGYHNSLTSDPENGFTGTMEGLGHFISDLTINRPSETDVGLFRFIDTSGVIRNIGLINAKVNGVFTVGGLVAYNNGSISQSYARGSVSGTLRDEADPVETPADAFSGMHVGGLVGRNNGSISQSYSSGEVNGAYSIGGLVGQNQKSGSISQSYSDSLVSGPLAIGGLAGNNLGSITQSYATGTVTGDKFLGGLAGSNRGTVLQSYATGAVTGEQYVGGLMGDNWGTISQSYATGVINGTEQVGGLVGYLAFSSDIIQSYATGAVTGEQYVGGLVGGNSNERELTNYTTGETETNPDFGGDIIQSYATGTVTGTNHVGGLVGFNDGVITQSYATGTATGDEHIGGLVGSNEYSSSFGDDISITQSYATGAVSGAKNVGGLVGQNNSGITEQSYATGAISGQSFVGGLVGINRAQATLNQSYASGMVNGSAGNLVGSGFLITINDSSMKTLAELKQLDSFSNWDIDAEGGSDSVWRLYEGYTTPLLRSFLRPLEVNAQDTTVTYNGSEQSGSWSANTPYDAALVQGSPTGGKNAGTYALDMSGLYSGQQGYDLITTNGTLTINKAQATVTANSNTTTYNGTEQNVSGFTVDGLVNGEDASVLSGVTTNGGKGTNAGSYTLTASGSADNYELTFVDGALTINKAQATVTANSGTTTYNGTEQSVDGFTVDGLVNGEDQSVLTGVTTSGGKGTNAGSYVLTVDGGSADNYELSFVDGTLTINKAQATVTANSGSTIYNGTEQSVSGFTVDGLVNDEDESVLSGVNTSGGKGTNAGSYVLTVGGSSHNYELTFVDGTLTIERKAITGSIIADSKTYDGSTYANTHGTLEGIVDGDDLQLDTEGTFADKNTSNGKQVDVTGSLTGDDAGNYLLISTNSSTSADISRKVVTASIEARDKLFDGTLVAVLEGTLHGTISGDDVVLVLDGNFSSPELGEHSVEINASLEGSDAGNYLLQAPDALTAMIRGGDQSPDYQAAITSQSGRQPQVPALAISSHLLEIDEDALHLPMASR
jgi:hypothetical protein